MGISYTSRPHSWSAQSFSGWSGLHALQGLFNHCTWWTWVEWTAKEVSLPQPRRKRWPENLVECFTHSVISQAYWGRIFVSVFMMIVLIIWERLTRRSPWSVPIVAILFAIRREVRIGWSSFSLLMAQASFQVINFLLHGFGIFLMGEMTTTPRMVPTSMGSMHTPILVSHLLKITEVISTLRPHGFV